MVMKLLGARKFLDMPKGTIYVRFCEFFTDDLKNVVNDFENNKLQIKFDDLLIYGDNTCSLCYNEYCDNFDFCHKYSCLDINIVGDAMPESTLYLVLDEEFVIKNFDKKQYLLLLNARDKFIKMFTEENKQLSNRLDDTNNWARMELERRELVFLGYDCQYFNLEKYLILD